MAAPRPLMRTKHIFTFPPSSSLRLANTRYIKSFYFYCQHPNRVGLFHFDRGDDVICVLPRAGFGHRKASLYDLLGYINAGNRETGRWYNLYLFDYWKYETLELREMFSLLKISSSSLLIRSSSLSAKEPWLKIRTLRSIHSTFSSDHS